MQISNRGHLADNGQSRPPDIKVRTTKCFSSRGGLVNIPTPADVEPLEASS